jgi:hypothetical protein
MLHLSVTLARIQELACMKLIDYFLLRKHCQQYCGLGVGIVRKVLMKR